VILVNMSVGQYNSTWIYLYCDYDGSLDESHNHSISEISVFSDDFNTDLSKWINSLSSISDGYVTIGNDGFIVSSMSSYNMEVPGDPPEILYSKTVNDSMYVVEAKMKINEGQGNMYFLADGTDSGLWDQSYMVSANVTPVDDFTLFKMDSNLPGPNKLTNMDNDPSVPDLNHWLRMKSYIYMSKTCYKPDSSTTNFENTTVIDAYLYNYDTFADDGNVSGWDTDIDNDPDDPPGSLWAFINQNFIGLGAGQSSPENSNITVDWVRVMKTPVVTPTVTVGAMESSNCGWTSTVGISSRDRPTDNPFNPGPVLRDFNYGTTLRTFIIKNLPKDVYTITVTKGDYNSTRDDMTIEFRDNSDNPRGTLAIPSTEKGEFETKWITINKNWEGDLQLQFKVQPPSSSWTVNSIIVERGEKGVKVGLD